MGVVAVAWLLRVSLALRYPNIFWPDEIFQSLEQAHRLAFGVGIVPWEFRDGTRSWIFPALLAAVMKVSAPLGVGSSGYMTGTIAVLGAVSLAPALVAFHWARRLSTDWLAVFAAVLPLFWFDLVYFSTKAFSEVLAGHVLVAAVYFLAIGDTRNRWILGGALLSAAISLRLHLAPTIVLGCFVAVRHGRKALGWSALGAAVIMLAAGLVDWLTWGAPFASYVRNFHVNVVQAKAELWGTAPPGQYLEWWRLIWSWSSIPFLGALLYGLHRLPSLAWTALVVLGAHSVIGHKEYRFVYPFVVLLCTLSGVAGAVALANLTRGFAAWKKHLATAAATMLILIASFVSATRFDSSKTQNTLGGGAQQSHWRRFSGSVAAFRYLSTVTDMCGVTLLHLPWYVSGGYTWLHQEVPLFEPRSVEELTSVLPGSNIVVGRGAKLFPPYELDRCFDDVCVYRRPGGCAAVEELTINSILIRRGE